MLPIEELSRPRFKAIADDTSRDFEKGEIFYQEQGKYYMYGDQCRWQFHPENFPHLFRKMDWWEQIEEKDMPRYLQFINDQGKVDFVLKVENYLYHKDTNRVWAFEYLWEQEKDIKRMSIQGWTPATEQEYIEHNKISKP